MHTIQPVTLTISAKFVWKVARYTSSAPVYFEPGESGEHRFVDGGVKANNPTDYAFTRIQKYLDEQLGALGQQVCTYYNQEHNLKQYCIIAVSYDDLVSLACL